MKRSLLLVLFLPWWLAAAEPGRGDPVDWIADGVRPHPVFDTSPDLSLCRGRYPQDDIVGSDLEKRSRIEACTREGEPARLPIAIKVAFPATKIVRQPARDYWDHRWVTDKSLSPQQIVERVCHGQVNGQRWWRASECRPATVGCTEAHFHELGNAQFQIVWKRLRGRARRYQVAPRAWVYEKGKPRSRGLVSVPGTYPMAPESLPMTAIISVLDISGPDREAIRKLDGYSEDGKRLDGDAILSILDTAIGETMVHEQWHVRIARHYARKLIELVNAPPVVEDVFHSLPVLKEAAEETFLDHFMKVIKQHDSYQKRYDALSHSAEYRRFIVFQIGDDHARTYHCLTRSLPPREMEAILNEPDSP